MYAVCVCCRGADCKHGYSFDSVRSVTIEGVYLFVFLPESDLTATKLQPILEKKIAFLSGKVGRSVSSIRTVHAFV